MSPDCSDFARSSRLPRMIHPRIIAAALVATFFLSFAPTPAAAPSRGVRVIVLFRERPDAELIAGFGGRVLTIYSIIPALAAEVPREALERLRSSAAVLRVEPDAIVRALGEQVPWGVSRIGAPNAWPTSTGEGVKVAILDTGIQYDHPDLAANVKGGISLVGAENSTDPARWNDVNGHGTHVAGIVAAVANDLGVVGVAPAAWLYAVKVLADNGEGYLSDVVEGIDWCVSNGMQVVNMSFGASEDFYSFRLACSKAYLQGLLLVAAAGNEGDGGVSYPAKYESVIAVAATDANDDVPSWSSKGPEVELAAPGVGIYSTYRGSSYATLSGTSMASPHVAGAAALLWARCPSLSNDRVRSLLRDLAEDLGAPGWDNCYGYGLVRVPVYEVTLSISPPEARGPPGGTLSYEVTVTNSGNAADNYSLAASDIEGWELALSEDLVSLTAGGVTSVQLTVTVPPTASLGSSNVVSVTAISLTDGAVRADASCTARAEGLAMEVVPSSKSGSPGENLSFAVIVSNFLGRDATLTLSATDTRGWGLEFLEGSLVVPSGESRVTLLLVSIPPEEVFGSVDNITISATSLDPPISASATCSARAGRIALPPSDDAQVAEGYPDSNYGAKTYVYVGNDLSSAYKNERGFFKFNLSAIPENFALATARLRNYCWRMTGASGGGVQARAVLDDTWNENTITWNNQPPHGDVLASVNVTTINSWYSWDVTSFVAGELLGDKLVSLCLRAESENQVAPYAFIYAFESKEWGEVDKRPHLEISDAPLPALSVSLSADFEKGAPGVTLYYRAIVVNLSGLEENYSLVASDNVGWVSGISPSLLTLAPGEAGTATVSVRVPSDAASGSSSRIVVIVSSSSGSSDFASSTAIAQAGVRTGRISIFSPYKNYPYWFRGNLHSHTENSDGENTASEMMFAYRYSGYSFNAITDHNYITDSEVFTDPPNFLGISGEEVTRGGGPHMVAISVENLIEGWATRSVAEWVADVLAQGGIPIAAHPGYSGAPFPLENLRQAVESGLRHIEIHGDEASGAKAREYWDALLAENRLVYGVMSDDAHSSSQVGRFGWVVVNAQELTREAILRSLRVGNFYCVRSSPPGPGVGPAIYNIAVENENAIVVNAEGDYVLFVGDNGVLLDNRPLVGGVAAYSPPAWTNYVRVEVHGEGGASYTQPLMVSVTRFRLATLYRLSLSLDAYVEENSELILKFYTYSGTYQGENVLWVSAGPTRLVLEENVGHPQGLAVENVVLALVRDGLPRTIASFTVSKGDLMRRTSEIKGGWPYASSGEKVALLSEISGIKSRWPYAPSS